MRKFFTILLFGFPLVAGAFNLFPVDSVGSRVIEGRQYLVHQVVPKETWFSLNRKYHISVQELRAVNPDVKVLLIGKTVLVPLTGNYYSNTRANGAFSATPPPVSLPTRGVQRQVVSPAAQNYPPPPSSNTAKMHIVQPGETMYRLSKMYGVSIAAIQQWNRIPDYTLSVGQSVIVSGAGGAGMVSSGMKPAYAPAFTNKGSNSYKDQGSPMSANERAVEIALNYVKKKAPSEPGDMSVLDTLEKKARKTIVNKNAISIGFPAGSQPAVARGAAPATAAADVAAPAGGSTAAAPGAKPAPGRPNIVPVSRPARPNIVPVTKAPAIAPVVAATPADGTPAQQPAAPAGTPPEQPKPAPINTAAVQPVSKPYTPPIRKDPPTAAPFSGNAAPYKPPVPVAAPVVPAPITTKVDHKKVEIPVTQTNELPKRDSNTVFIASSQVKKPVTAPGEAKAPVSERVERGTAAWINDEDVNPSKFYALHKFVPVGTIVKVTNVSNGQSVFVKVVGALPETADNANLVIKISKSAAKKLVVMEPKFQAELSYGMPQ